MFSFLSVNNVLFFSRNSENRQVVDTVLNIACLLVSVRLVEAKISD